MEEDSVMLCDFIQDKNMGSQKPRNKKNWNYLSDFLKYYLKYKQTDLQIIPAPLFLSSFNVLLKQAHFHGMSGIQVGPFTTYTIDI